MLKNKTIAFLGAGNMAEAMISGTVQSGKIAKDQIIVSNRSNKEKLQEINEKYGVRTLLKDQLPFSEIDILILAMKPKDIDKALDSINHLVKSDTVIMSVLAGITTSHMEEQLPGGQSVIRVMPNTSSMLKESATAISAGRFTSEEDMMNAKELLSSIGEVYVIDESKMDIFTGIAGSGPAYFYYLMEHIEKTGAEAGLDPQMARKIGAQTIFGAAKMMLEREETPTQLRENVTSPNGTTAAGLDALAQFGGGKAISEAVKGAEKRSKEISSELQSRQLVTN
ncbi:pyrroline-5-carboxylate reductase [[Bacillus] enclensis]|uniref:Pyrroline-5-carboxylate reductase n=2 Tax=Rossellomorea TaxID=2837508 RepID=A0A0V8HL64_9BACI|nr:pyrroline-5-carboxylate reductase [[Bacillus] enclensis]KSU63236.1 pyrroline-5-carboxylate reductase [[Bacillus] enclensis]OAT83797.1 pyrroline-5-carboxylate reductase [Bacillus sp. MKU004]SCB80573.1 pyrroline-5-carboxylate reductase [[Bacillus] enclensis]